MDIFGIGPLELFFIVLIMLIVLGPKDMVKAGQTMGKTIRKIVTSPTWRLVRNTSRTLQNLPNTLAREAGMDEIKRDLLAGTKAIDKELKSAARGIQSPPGKPATPSGKTNTTGEDKLSAWTTPPLPGENTIAPPRPALAGDGGAGTEPPIQSTE